MAVVRPFAALRPAPERAAQVAAVPYDVVGVEEARRLAAGNPFSFLHVSRAEIDLPDGTDPYGEAVYEGAAANFRALKRDAPLVREADAHLYAYRLRMGEHVQTGIAGCCSLADYDRDLVRKHERTRKDKEDDRTRHMIALRAQTGPVFLTYRDAPAIDREVERAVREPALYDFTADDGVRHTLWRLSPDGSRRVEREFEAVPLLYIADGHHRAASASRARHELAAKAPAGGGPREHDTFLAVAFPAGQVSILPYNRIVKDLNGRSPTELLAALRERFGVRDGAAPSPARKGEVSLYLDGKWYGIELPRHAEAGSIASLDASLLQEEILRPIFGIADVRTDKRIDFIGGVRGTEELERLVAEGRAAAAFSLYPVSIGELLAIADANEIMPPKSTWFEPKLRDGLLIHEI